MQGRWARGPGLGHTGLHYDAFLHSLTFQDLSEGVRLGYLTALVFQAVQNAHIVCEDRCQNLNHRYLIQPGSIPGPCVSSL